MKKTILVVDDDPSITSIFEFILQQAGYNTITASSGDSCLEILRKKKPIDLIFLDVKMDGLSGIETLKEVLKIDATSLVIMMTGYSVDKMLQEALDLGAYGVIYKPFDVEEVLSTLSQIFQTSNINVS